MGYWSPNEVHLVGSGLDGGLHRRGEGRCRGESVYLHPFITICLMAYECLHGYSREREREIDGGTEMAPIGKVGSQQGTAVRV